LKRVFAVDVLTCARCQGPMRLIAVINDERTASEILAHLGRPSRAPPRGSRRAPSPQVEIVDDAPDYDAVDPPSVLD
jgi:hypothetical protein